MYLSNIMLVWAVYVDGMQISTAGSTRHKYISLCAATRTDPHMALTEAPIFVIVDWAQMTSVRQLMSYLILLTPMRCRPKCPGYRKIF